MRGTSRSHEELEEDQTVEETKTPQNLPAKRAGAQRSDSESETADQQPEEQTGG
jgi:hypothetical protein